MEIEKEELLNTRGGIKISAALITSIYKSISFIYEVGKALGGAINRIKTKRMC